MSDVPTSEFTRQLGMETVSIADGVCVIELELDARHMSVARRAHGGVLFAMLDTVMGRSILSKLPPGRGCATIEASIHYFRPVQSGRIRAEGRLVRLTRRIAYAEGTLCDADGVMLARSAGSFFLTETIEQSERERI
jgi:acyl-CoA thioesterase